MMQDRQFDSTNMAFGSIQQILGWELTYRAMSPSGMARGEDLEWTTDNQRPLPQHTHVSCSGTACLVNCRAQ